MGVGNHIELANIAKAYISWCPALRARSGGLKNPFTTVELYPLIQNKGYVCTYVCTMHDIYLEYST